MVPYKLIQLWIQYSLKTLYITIRKVISWVWIYTFTHNMNIYISWVWIYTLTHSMNSYIICMDIYFYSQYEYLYHEYEYILSLTIRIYISWVWIYTFTHNTNIYIMSMNIYFHSQFTTWYKSQVWEVRWNIRGYRKKMKLEKKISGYYQAFAAGAIICLLIFLLSTNT